VKIVNNTDWPTRPLRSLIARIARHEIYDAMIPARAALYKTLCVHVKYGAIYNGSSGPHIPDITLFVPREGMFDPEVAFAWLVTRHCINARGVATRLMGTDVVQFTDKARDQFAWARGLLFGKDPPKVKAAPTSADRMVLSLANAKLKLAIATTRLKRATTIEKKWRRRVKLLATRAANAQVITAETRKLALDVAAAKRARTLAKRKMAIQEVDGIKTYNLDEEMSCRSASFDRRHGSTGC
jgi:hypothetical protein